MSATEVIAEALRGCGVEESEKVEVPAILTALAVAGYEVTLQPLERGVGEYLALRYADDPVEAFNLFIKAWVSESRHGHLLDDDENDGEFVRGHIRAAMAAQR